MNVHYASFYCQIACLFPILANVPSLLKLLQAVPFYAQIAEVYFAPISHEQE